MVDTHAAHELTPYIDNDGDLYRRQTTSILANLMTKRARAVYQHDLGVKLFGHLAEEGAKKYAREFGSGQPWHKMFDVSTRKQAAEELARAFEREAALGNYDRFLPKKYRGQGQRKKAVPPRGVTLSRARDSVYRRDQEARSTGVPSQAIREFRGFLRNASDSQVQGIYEKERRAGRDDYAELASAEAERRGISLDGHYHQARRRSPAQLNHEIATALGRRYRRGW